MAVLGAVLAVALVIIHRTQTNFSTKKVSEKKHTFPTPFQENTFVCYAFRV